MSAEACRPRAAAEVAALRTPLGRIELAASQLARDATTPAARELAQAISRAVADLDAQVGAALRHLAPAPRTRESAPGPASALFARLEPVLAARGASLEVEGFAEPEGQSHSRAALALLRAALADRPAPGARFRLAQAASGLRLDVSPHPAPDPEAWSAARAFASECGLALEMAHAEGRLQVRLEPLGAGS